MFKHHTRWIIIALSFMGVLVNYFDRSAIAYAIAPLKLDFGLSNTEFGTVAAAFGLGYMLMTMSSGVLMIFCFAFAGILAPSITGVLSSVTGNFNATIWLMIGLTLTSALGIILFQHPDRQ